MRKLIIGLGTIVTSLFVTVVPVLASGYYDYTPYTANDAAAAGLFGVSSLITLVCACCLPLIVGGVLAVIVYKDAQKNHVENAVLWAVLTFFFNLLGVLIYFLAIRPDAMRKMGGHTASKPSSEDKSE